MEETKNTENKTEVQNTVQNKIQVQTRKDRAAQIMEIKMRRAEDSGSIVFIPVGGMKGQEFGKNLLALNKHVRILKSSAVFGDIESIKRQLTEIENIRDEMWDKIKAVIPRFSSFSPKRWSEINNPRDEKIRLAQRRISYVITPTDDTTGSIIMAAKVLSEKIIESQASSSLDELSELIGTYRMFNEKITNILNDGKNGGKTDAQDISNTENVVDTQKVPEPLEAGTKTGKKK
jgi:hypothetical protein